LEVRARAPTKVTLFGEHAVVYGYPAVAAAVPKFVEVSMRFRGSGSFTISFESPYFRASVNRVVLPRLEVSVEVLDVEKFVAYVRKAIEMCSSVVGGLDAGLDVKIVSEVPPSIGLGTSASVSIATLMACLELHGVKLRRDEIAELGWRIEYEVQGAASPMDTATVALGGVRLIDPKSLRHELLRDELDVLVGFIPRRGTTAALVNRVKVLRDRFPNVVESVMECIARVVRDSVDAVRRGDVETLGLLANVNHGLLHALGVVPEEMDRVLHGLRKAGALGAKVSGAGGGGAFIAFAKPEELETLARVAKALGTEVATTRVGCPGASIVPM